MVARRSSPILWQCWLSLLQLPFGCYGFGYSVYQLDLICRDPFNYPGWFVVFMSSLIVIWILVLANDLFTLIFDFERTNTYLGCYSAQMGINFVFASMLFVYLGVWVASYQLYKAPPPATYMFAIAILVCFLCSLCLLVIILQSTTRLNRMWTSNTKDIFLGEVSPVGVNNTLSFFGDRRETPLFLEKEIYGGLHALALQIKLAILDSFGLLLFSFFWSTKKFLSHILLRRVRPVETRVYAFIRNGFALIATGLLVFRVITALVQAQNQIGTRMVSANCSERAHFPQVLVGLDSNSQNISVVVSNNLDRIIPNTLSEGNNCRSYTNRSQEIERTGNPLALYLCEYEPRSSGQFRYSGAIHIEARGINGTSLLNLSPMPPIWFSNLLDGTTRKQLQNHSQFFDLIYAHAAPTLLPSWELYPGIHIEAEAKLITRKSIKSSIWKDVILSSKPTYRLISLYPIVESPIGVINYPNTSIATATIRLSMRPGFAYPQDRAVNPGTVCDFIEDYRSGTVLDVIGSVGGLFALLQAAHVLLFGRPLFWGLTGAKLITPFGLLGACSSKGFKRRLKEQYHRNAADENSETIRVGAFLRDFVIDFGPADIEPEGHRLRGSATSSPKLTTNDSEEGSYGSQVPLMQLRASDTSVSRKESNADRGDCRSNNNQIDNVV